MPHISTNPWEDDYVSGRVPEPGSQSTIIITGDSGRQVFDITGPVTLYGNQYVVINVTARPTGRRYELTVREV